MKFTIKSYSFYSIKGYTNKDHYVKKLDVQVYYQYKDINSKTSTRQCI